MKDLCELGCHCSTVACDPCRPPSTGVTPLTKHFMGCQDHSCQSTQISCLTSWPLCYFSAVPWPLYEVLTHWGWVTHICISKLTIIGSDNGLSSGQRQTIIWNGQATSHYLKQCWYIHWALGTNFNEISIKIHTMIFIQENQELITYKFLRKPISKCFLENGGHFVSASMC